MASHIRTALFVAPHPWASGEVSTAAHAARDLAAAGCAAHLLASRQHGAAFGAAFAGTHSLGMDLADNTAMLRRVIDETSPDIVVFCDAALVDTPTGSLPMDLADAIDVITGSGCRLATFDHLGIPLSAAWPPDAAILRPCPMGSPLIDSGPGRPVSVTRPVAELGGIDDLPERVPGGLRIVHTVAPWAIRIAIALKHPLHKYLPAIVESYLADLDRPVQLLSVNNGSLLPAAPHGRLRVVNLPPQPAAVFDQLLADADLVVTENPFASTIGRAIDLGTPAVAWQHTLGIVDVLATFGSPVAAPVAQLLMPDLSRAQPWIAFPTWTPEPIRGLSLSVLDNNPVTSAFARLELFGGAASATALQDMLTDSPLRRGVLEAQEQFRASVRQLPRIGEALVEASVNVGSTP
ncbi:DUF6365 family protein [Streptomyces sp. NPDC059989]|uniref:DUF6365 family protein n=1 Tax=Streptomyces sp. NPDC059989 TaxID=3347026 RepID=UPI0036C3BAE9